ncbi:MAG TPA: hypothetical protein VGV59_12040 [Pyrinomonadaceae bacterium]|nr:hypothetical protein [Pyrinomonadaceae bacterium]
MSANTREAEGAAARQSPTEQQQSRPGIPKRFAPGQTVCNEKTEKGKLCNGHIKQIDTVHPSDVYLRGDDVLHRCQTCGTLYMGPPHGHVRDSRKQTRYVQRDLAAILQAAGGTLPAYGAPSTPPRVVAPKPKTTPSTSGTDSSPAADRHRPAAEAQAATGQPSAAPMSPAAATASPAAGAETPADLSPEASTELTPGAPRDERTPPPEAAPAPAAAAAPAASAPPAKGAAKKKEGAHAGFKVPPELNTAPPGETHEEKIARLKRLVEAAKRDAGKL